MTVFCSLGGEGAGSARRGRKRGRGMCSSAGGMVTFWRDFGGDSGLGCWAV